MTHNNPSETLSGAQRDIGNFDSDLKESIYNSVTAEIERVANLPANLHKKQYQAWLEQQKINFITNHLPNLKGLILHEIDLSAKHNIPYVTLHTEASGNFWELRTIYGFEAVKEWLNSLGYHVTLMVYYNDQFFESHSIQYVKDCYRDAIKVLNENLSCGYPISRADLVINWFE